MLIVTPMVKNNTPFISCISKAHGKFIKIAEYLEIVMLTYNLTGHSKNYRKTTAPLINYYRDQPNSGTKSDGNNGINYSIKDSKFFDYKTNITEELDDDNVEKNVKIAIPLKYLSNFWRNLDMPLIICEISMTSSWYEICILTSKATKNQILYKNPPIAAINNPKNAVFEITDTKLYVPVVTLSSEEYNEL